jgi:hypothetical protein
MLLLAWKIFVKRRLIIRGNDCMGSEILAINSLKISQFLVRVSYIHLALLLPITAFWGIKVTY